MKRKFKVWMGVFCLLGFWTLSCRPLNQSQNKREKIGSADSGADKEFQIIDGERVPSSRFPQVAKINVGQGSCTGTLIALQVVLTAGHCLYGQQASQVSLELGGQSYQSTRLLVHPDYNPNPSPMNTFNNTDAGLIFIASAPRGIKPLTLQKITPQPGQKITIVGYGLIGSGFAGQQGVPEPGSIYQGQNRIALVEGPYIYTRFDRGTASTAPGDSGGPAFMDNQLIAITTSGTSQIVTYGDIAFYQRIDLILPWIQSELKKQNSTPSTVPEPTLEPMVFPPITPEATAVAGNSPGPSVLPQEGDGCPIPSRHRQEMEQFCSCRSFYVFGRIRVGFAIPSSSAAVVGAFFDSPWECTKSA